MLYTIPYTIYCTILSIYWNVLYYTILGGSWKEPPATDAAFWVPKRHVCGPCDGSYLFYSKCIFRGPKKQHPSQGAPSRSLLRRMLLFGSPNDTF